MAKRLEACNEHDNIVNPPNFHLISKISVIQHAFCVEPSRIFPYNFPRNRLSDIEWHSSHYRPFTKQLQPMLIHTVCFSFSYIGSVHFIFDFFFTSKVFMSPFNMLLMKCMLYLTMFSLARMTDEWPIAVFGPKMINKLGYPNYPWRHLGTLEDRLFPLKRLPSTAHLCP